MIEGAVERVRPKMMTVVAIMAGLLPIMWGSGTGSEVGRSSVVSDDATHVKRVVFSPKLLARCVFADPELTLDLPPGITAATGMDAITHCIEAIRLEDLLGIPVPSEM